MTKKKFLVASVLVVMLMFYFTGCPAETVGGGWPGNSAKITYGLLPDGTYSVVSVTSMQPEGILANLYVTIPADYNGKKVTAIGMNAFWGQPVVNVTLPATITSIGNAAFGYCRKLEAVIFEGQPQEKNILRIPANITSIGYMAFSNTNFTEIIIPDTVLSVGDRVFEECEFLTKIQFGKFTTADAFLNDSDQFVYPYLKEIIVSAANNSYSTSDGALLSAGGEYLIAVPATKTAYTIPATVSVIKEAAFYDSDITALVIPATVKTIESGAFDTCLKLETIDIKGITNPAFTTFGNKFSRYEKLKTITVAYNNDSYSTLDGVLYNKGKTALLAYPAASAKTSFVIPDTVTTAIAQNVFFKYAQNPDNQQMEYMPPPNTALTSITLGKNTSGVDVPNIPFYNFPNLATIAVAAGNTFLKVNTAGALVNAADTSLYAFPPAKVATGYTFSGATQIMDNAFRNCTKLTGTVTFVKDTTLTGSNAFAGCNEALVLKDVNDSNDSNNRTPKWNPDGLKVTYKDYP